jgi:uncharacterized glyoxalase superfamily protein PhnB
MNAAMIPVFRSFDLAKAKEFYCEFLGWKIDWTHRLGENFPLYMQVSKGPYVLHLSEHHGDASPGSTVRLYVDEIDELCAQLKSTGYKYAKPEVEETSWKTKEMYIKDPFGNKLKFFQRLP